ncbi:hypothetical protein [Prauserella shujinwangii]|uniref:hypothetical protein n=1 Tax=Prauserella shujinwangii TaxID=1453103 RepID=UPI003CCBA0F1
MAVVRLRRGVVGETRRVCHVVPLPGPGEIPDSLTALCGADLRPGEAELLHGITGMPCEPCLAKVAPSVGQLSAAG